MPDRKNEIARIHVYELRIGMCVCRLEMPDQESAHLFYRFDIKTQADIQAIQSICDYVLIDSNWQQPIPEQVKRNKALGFAATFEQSAHTYQETGDLIKHVMEDVRFGNPLSIKAVKEAASQCVDKVLENSDAMLLLTQLKHQDQYTAQHSLNVCILAILLGRELGLSGDDLNTLGLCALLHDIGKARIPLEILNKPGKLEDEELDIMRLHPEFGRDILTTTSNIAAEAVDVSYNHHENLVGTGYPRGLDKTSLSNFSKIVAIADVYDAITSDRVYQQGRPHLLALDILAQGMHTQFDAELVVRFVNCIGLYPQGNLVEFTNGEVGIVVQQNKNDRLKPKVLLVLDEHRNAVDERLLDLACDTYDRNGTPYTIAKVIRPQDCGIDLVKFYRDGKFTRRYPVVG
ncbi:MAG: HD-GYP domain-containing protein [Methylobacter sp.]